MIFLKKDPLTLASLEIKKWRTTKAESKVSLDALLKKAVWAYFLLLIFEGALRKWILPGLATPLLIIRDPLAIWILVQSVKKRYLKQLSFLNSQVRGRLQL